MSFDNNSSCFKTQQIVEKNRNNLIDSHSDHRDEIALFLKLHFYDVNKIEKQDLFNIDLYFIKFFLNLSCSFN